jgi:tagatose 1,6-diphosphate aldolase GatY/KbaY
MRTRLDELVVTALKRGSAVPAFTCYDFTTALAVVSAAEEAKRGVILLVAPKTAATANGLRSSPRSGAWPTPRRARGRAARPRLRS